MDSHIRRVSLLYRDSIVAARDTSSNSSKAFYAFVILYDMLKLDGLK